MARISAKDSDLSINAVAIEDEINSTELAIDVDLPEVTAFADVAKVSVEGKYGWNLSVEGSADLAASQGDATIFALLGGGSVTTIYTPGGGAEGANNPDYTGSVFLESYRLRSAVGEAVSYSAQFRGSGALTRDVTP